MKSVELADEVEMLVQSVRERVMGVGDEQYSEGDTQKFERVPFLDLLNGTLEELDDVVVYAAMLRIRIRRIMQQFQDRSTDFS